MHIHSDILQRSAAILGALGLFMNGIADLDEDDPPEVKGDKVSDMLDLFLSRAAAIYPSPSDIAYDILLIQTALDGPADHPGPSVN